MNLARRVDSDPSQYSHLSERDVERKLLLSYRTRLDVEERPKMPQDNIRTIDERLPKWTKYEI